VQRRVCEHHPERLLARSDLLCYLDIPPPLQENYGPGRRGEKHFLLRCDAAQFPHLRKVAGHERERLVLAHLAAPKRPNRRGVERVAGQVVASEALYGDDGPSAQQLRRPRDGVARLDAQLVSETVQEPHPGSAH
jgi:hypothetical protein